MELKKIISEMKSGNFNNYRDFYSITSGFVCVIIHNVVGDSLYSDSIVTEIYNEIYQNIKQAPDGIAFMQWLGRIATVKSYEFMKNNSEELTNVTLDMKSTGNELKYIFIPEVAIDNVELQKKIFDRIAKRDFLYKTVFYLHFICAVSTSDISSLIRINEGEIDNYVFDVLENIRSTIENFYGNNTSTMMQLDAKQVLWKMFVNGYRYVLREVPENMLAYGEQTSIFNPAMAGAGAGAGAVMGFAGNAGVSGSVSGGFGVSAGGGVSSSSVGNAVGGLKGDLAGRTAVGGYAGNPVTGVASVGAEGAHGAGTVPIDVAKASASKGFLGTAAGKITVAMVSLAVVGSIGGGVFYYLSKKADDTPEDKVVASATTEVADKGSSDSTSEEITTEEPTTEYYVDSADMYNVRVEQIPELCGDTEYVYIDGDKYGALKEAVEKDSQELSPNKDLPDGIGSVSSFCSSRAADLEEVDYNSFAQEIGSYKWVNIMRCDSRVLDINYCKKALGPVEYISKKYDVNTGKELTLEELGVTEDEFRTLVSAKLTDEYNTSELLKSADNYNSSAINSCVDSRTDKACEVLFNTYNTDYENYAPADHSADFCDRIFFDMVYDGIKVTWATSYTDPQLGESVSVVIPYDEFAAFDADYLPDSNTFSGMIDGTMSIDVNNDGQPDDIESLNNYENDYSSAVVVNRNTVKHSSGGGTIRNGFVIKNTDGKCYMIITYVMGSLYNYSYDEDRTNGTYIYDLTSGGPVTIASDITDIRAICASGEYVFCQDMTNGEYGYYTLTDDGLVYDSSIYTDDTELARCYGLYSREIVRKSNNYSDYALAYIDDDDIPELYMDATFSFGGCAVYAFYNNKLVRQGIGVSNGGGYAERQGTFCGVSYRYGINQIFIYSYKDGVFNELVHGSEQQQPYDPAQGDEPYYNYYINDEQFTEQEYNDRINSLMDESKKIMFYDDKVDDVDTILSKLK